MIVAIALSVTSSTVVSSRSHDLARDVNTCGKNVKENALDNLSCYLVAKAPNVAHGG